jgi:hypothetical protein
VFRDLVDAGGIARYFVGSIVHWLSRLLNGEAVFRVCGKQARKAHRFYSKTPPKTEDISLGKWGEFLGNSYPAPERSPCISGSRFRRLGVRREIGWGFGKWGRSYNGFSGSVTVKRHFIKKPETCGAPASINPASA